MTRPERAADVALWILPCRGRTVRLPRGFRLARCRFDRRQGDLLLEQASGERLVLRDFYRREMPPYIRDEMGVLLPGELARLLPGLTAQAQALVMADGYFSRRNGIAS